MGGPYYPRADSSVPAHLPGRSHRRGGPRRRATGRARRARQVAQPGSARLRSLGGPAVNPHVECGYDTWWLDEKSKSNIDLWMDDIRRYPGVHWGLELGEAIPPCRWWTGLEFNQFWDDLRVTKVGLICTYAMIMNDVHCTCIYMLYAVVRSTL